MKKNFLLLMMFYILILFVGCSSQTDIEYISEQIDIKMPNALRIEYIDNHGGLQQDGETFGKVEFDSENSDIIVSEIKNNNNWNDFPLPKQLALDIYGYKDGEVEHANIFDEQWGVSNIENGYWMFVNRNGGVKSFENDDSIYKTTYDNFTISIYDIDTKTLYFYEFDL